MRRQILLTEGAVLPTLARFSLPFLLGSLLQALYGASDLFMVGRFADSAGVSAVATGGQVLQLITGLAIGLTTGGTVRVARHAGARHKTALVDAAATVLTVFGALSIILAAAVWLMSAPLCAALRVPEAALEITQEYLSICAWGIPFIVGYNAVSAILRGLGDSRSPLYFMVAACLINVSTDLLFVGGMGWGAPGAALSTVIAQAASLALACGYLARGGYVRRLWAAAPRVRSGEARSMLAVGLPIALQEGLVNASFLLITAAVNTLGLTASAAVGVVEKLIVFSMLPSTAFAAAVAAMTAQNQGAGQAERARRSMRAGIGLSLVFGFACLILAQTGGPELVALFTADPAVIRVGAGYLRSYSVDCVIVCFVFCMNAYFSGSGRAVFPLAHSLLATFLVRVPVCFILSRIPGISLFYLGFAAPAASFLSLMLCQSYLGYLQRGRSEKGSL